MKLILDNVKKMDSKMNALRAASIPENILWVEDYLEMAYSDFFTKYVGITDLQFSASELMICAAKMGVLERFIDDFDASKNGKASQFYLIRKRSDRSQFIVFQIDRGVAVGKKEFTILKEAVTSKIEQILMSLDFAKKVRSFNR